MRAIWPGLISPLFIGLALGPALGDVVISTSPTQNIGCSSGVCVPTAVDAVFNSNDLQNMLAASNVSISTTGSGVQANNIVVASKFSWKASNGLTLDAYDSITVNAPVTVKGKSSVTVNTNDGGTGGVFVFGPQGRMDIRNLATNLVINGASFVLVNSVSSLASAVTVNTAGNYALTTNYDASGDGTYYGMPIATEVSGNVQGLGNTISNLSVRFARMNKLGGVIYDVSSTGSIQNLRLVNERTQIGKQAGWGGLTGGNVGLLFNDSVTGTFKTNCA
ncbi:MAG TPA: hypothetical protein VGK90_01320, partial [Rhizomicrobium sp.]